MSGGRHCIHCLACAHHNSIKLAQICNIAITNVMEWTTKIICAVFLAALLAARCFGEHESGSKNALHLYVPSKSTASPRIISLEGKSFGWDVRSALNTPIKASLSRFYGEIVFTTAMTGYVESLTDPSYAGQILILTYPLVGNYGVPSNESSNSDLNCGIASNGHQSLRIQAKAVIIADLSINEMENNKEDLSTHWQRHTSLNLWMKSEKVPGIYGVDTRALVKLLRHHGSLNAALTMPHVGREEMMQFFQAQRLTHMPRHWLLRRHYSSKTWSCNTCDDKVKNCLQVLIINFGVKHGIIHEVYRVARSLDYNLRVDVVPYYSDTLESRIKKDNYNGVILSNGPGNPAEIVEDKAFQRSIYKVILNEGIPTLGICLGHQIISIVLAEQNTSTLKFGHRGHNHPVFLKKDDKRGFITSQNHQYYMKPSPKSDEWVTMFEHLHDRSNAGIYNKNKPIFAVQFHPEGGGGPTDTSGFIFKTFLNSANEFKGSGTVKKHWPPRVYTNTPTHHYSQKSIKKVLVLGSGGIQIGQAGEFDYTGSQVLKALRAVSVETVLLNPNVASIQTLTGMANKTIFAPLSADSVAKVLNDTRPDGILLSFGGQTALNVGIELHEKGILESLGVKVLGTSIDSIKLTEDRGKFKQFLEKINEPLADSKTTSDLSEVVSFGKSVGFPVLIRRAFALGGFGSGFAENEEELYVLAEKAMSRDNPGSSKAQIIIDKSLRGWKEVEYEVVRDFYGNVFVVCNMENFDPLGVHTGDSIVVTPSQTLNDHEYQALRRAAIKIASEIRIIGECNIQFAVNPDRFEYVVVEVNPRLSRSSALASKATGYPIAKIAARISLGESLTNIKNPMTKTAAAFMEPSLDYVVVKVPRWDFRMFDGILDVRINTGMKSIGEVMAIGRNFAEAFQKALRMVQSNKVLGFEPLKDDSAKVSPGKAAILGRLQQASPRRPYDIAMAFENNITVNEIAESTHIDKYFLILLEEIHYTSMRLRQYESLSNLPERLLLRAKQLGFSDMQIADKIGSSCSMEKVREHRISFGIKPSVKQIDTTSGEFLASSSYFFMTYNAYSTKSAGLQHDDNEDTIDGSSKLIKPILIIGSGVFRVGSSIEFDNSVVICSRIIESNTCSTENVKHRTIILNHNPETVSTDYDESSSLYFEEINLERILDILEAENGYAVIVNFGGQVSQNLIPRLLPYHSSGKIRILGTSPQNIAKAENRMIFSTILDEHGIKQPAWISSYNKVSMEKFVSAHNFPLLVRPSFVLAGAAMRVCRNQQELDSYLSLATKVSIEYPVVISKYFENNNEIDVDAVAFNGKLKLFEVAEHIEHAGVHSGDATFLYPPISLSQNIVDQIKNITQTISLALNISGPFNLQIMHNPVSNELLVIEANVRASRSMPFLSQASGSNFAREATIAILKSSNYCAFQRLQGAASFGNENYKTRKHFGVKAAVFSFDRLPGADVKLSVTMKATGEVACFDANPYVAFLCAMRSANRQFPVSTRWGSKDSSNVTIVCISTDIYTTDESAMQITNLLMSLRRLGYEIKSCSIGGNAFLNHDRENQYRRKSMIPNFHVLLDFTTAKVFLTPQEQQCKANSTTAKEDYLLRRACIDRNIPVFTNIQLVKFIAEAYEQSIPSSNIFLR